MIILPGRSSSWGGVPTDAEIETIISADSNSGMWVPRAMEQFITDPGFDSGVAFWSVIGSANLTHTGSAMSVEKISGDGSGAVSDGFATVIGNMYQVTCTLVSGSSAYLIKSDSSTTYASNRVDIFANQGAGTYTGYFVATATTTYLHATMISATTCVYDNCYAWEMDMGYGGPESTTNCPKLETNGDGDFVGTWTSGDWVAIDQTPTSTFSLYLRLRTTDTLGVCVSDAGGSNYAGVWQDGSGSSPHTGAGSPTYYIDGGSALSSPTRDTLDTEIRVPSGWITVRVKSIDASSWGSFDPLRYSGASGMDGECAGMIWCPDSLGDTNDADFVAYLADLAA